MKTFKHLNVPETWEHYWSKYPEGYTILEALLNWVKQVDSMVDNVNDWNKYLDGFVKQFDKELQNTVVEILAEWQADGTLDIVIDEALQTQIDNVEDRIDGFGYNIVAYGVREGANYAEQNTIITQKLLDDHQNIIIPPGTYHFQGDIRAPFNSIIRGSGYLSELVFNDGGLIYPDGEKFTLKDFRLKRTGTVGPALDIVAEGYGWRRFFMSNVHVLGSTGTGMRFKEGWIGTVINAVVQECNIGVEIDRGTIYGASANNLNFYGGEFQANMTGLKAYGVKGLNFFGTCIEGNTMYGVHFQGSMRDVVFYGSYFEANGTAHGGKEIFLDMAYPNASAYNIRFDGGGFLRGRLGTFDVFDIRGGKNIVISDGVSFYGYQDAKEPIIKVTEGFPSHTTGYVGAVLGNFPVLMSNETLSFGKQRYMSYGVNILFAAGKRTHGGFNIRGLEFPTRDIEFEYTIYVEEPGVFSITEKWAREDGTLLRDNVDGVQLKAGFNKFSRVINLGGYVGEIKVLLTRNGQSAEDTFAEDIIITQADVRVIDNPQKL